MADFPIFPIPASAIPSITPSQTVQTAGTQLPPALATLPAGSILSGFVLNRNNAGNPILRTQSGDFLFQTDFFLKIGSEVVIRLENVNNSLRARILTVNGQTPEAAEQQSAFVQEPEVIVGQPSPPQERQAPPQQGSASASSNAIPGAPARVLATGLITGTVLSLPVAAEQSGDALPQPGAQVTLRVVSITAGTPSPAALQAIIPAAAATPFYAAYARASPIPVPAAVFSATPAPSPATSLASRPEQPAASNSAAPAYVEALVIGAETTGETVVQTPIGNLRLATVAPIATGTKLSVELINVPLPGAGNLLASQTPADLPELGQRWSSLQRIFQLLAEIDAQSGLAPYHNGLPWLSASPVGAPLSAAPQQSFPAGLLVFLSALKEGDFHTWLGDRNVRLLRDRGHGELLGRAEGEFLLLARQHAEPAPHQWQTLFFPVMVNGELQQARLFLKRERKPATAVVSAEEDTRFIVEVDLTQLGEMQMDGFVKRLEGKVEFDLIIRSQHPLSAEAQREILAIYTSAGELTGYHGVMQFQAGRHFPVHPMEELGMHPVPSIEA